MDKEWFSAAELAAQGLPGMPGTRDNVLKLAKRQNWLRAEWRGTKWRPRAGRGGGVEFHYSVLSTQAQIQIAVWNGQIERDARAEQLATAMRFISLIHATNDQRTLEMIAEMFGWARVARKFLPLLQAAAEGEDHG